LTRVLKVVFVSGEDAISAAFLDVFLVETVWAPPAGAAAAWFEDGVEDWFEGCAEDCDGDPA
jgi:hypothetical protein